MPDQELTVRQEQALATRDEYYSAPGLSYSGMKDLAVSPLRYWHLHVSPDRPVQEETPAMAFGSALHCAMLQPSKFQERYTCEPDWSKVEGLLVTVADLRAWLTANGYKPKGTLKADLIDQVLSADPGALVKDSIEARLAEANQGKTVLSLDDWERLDGCINALMRNCWIADALSNGEAEIPIFAEDPETGVSLKAKLDWATPTLTLDLKTFAQKRSKSIDETVADAIWFEGYHIQAWWYTMMRSLADGDIGMSNPQTTKPSFALAFVESEPPHEVRIRVLRPTTSGQANLYWERARIHCREMIRLYAECWDRFGTDPWLFDQGAVQLMDEDIKQLAFA